jgi:multidrug efflux system outer membrane protein
VGTPITQTAAAAPIPGVLRSSTCLGVLRARCAPRSRGRPRRRPRATLLLLSVASATASGYTTLRGLDARADILRATIAARAEALRNARDQARVGYTSQLELRNQRRSTRQRSQLLPQIQTGHCTRGERIESADRHVAAGDRAGPYAGHLRRPRCPMGFPRPCCAAVRTSRRRRPTLPRLTRLLPWRARSSCPRSG